MKVRFYNADYSEDIDDGNKFPEPEETFDCRNYLDGAWNVKYVASGYPWLVRKGEKLTYKQVMGNNGFNDSMGDNETNRRGLIGKTYDGKIGIAVVGVGDADGQQGILIPNSLEYDAVREIAAGMGGSMGSSISISTDAGAQTASDLGKGVIQGVSQYITKKMRTVKVTLKAGHRLLLHSPKQ